MHVVQAGEGKSGRGVVAVQLGVLAIGKRPVAGAVQRLDLAQGFREIETHWLGRFGGGGQAGQPTAAYAVARKIVFMLVAPCRQHCCRNRGSKQRSCHRRGRAEAGSFFLTLVGWVISMNLVLLVFRSPRDQGDARGFNLLWFRPGSSFRRLAAIVDGCRSLDAGHAVDRHRASRGFGSRKL